MAALSTIRAVTACMETGLPKFVLDQNTGITFEWAFNAPVLRFESLVSSMGRSLLCIFGTFLWSVVFRRQLPWLLPFHILVVTAFVILTKLTTKPCGNDAVWEIHADSYYWNKSSAWNNLLVQIIFTSAHDGFECSSVAPCVSRTTGIKKNRFAGFLTKMLKEPANLGEGIPCGKMSRVQ